MVHFTCSAAPARAQQPVDRARLEAVAREYQVHTEPPGPERLFRLDSEAALRERIRQDYRQRYEQAEFPKESSRAAGYVATTYDRAWAPQVAVRIPHVVCHNPLYFEDKNVERYAWDFPLLQPALSLGKFYWDFVTLPYNVGVMGPCACDCQTDYDQPAQPVPYYVYVPPFSWKGAAYQTGAVLGGIALFP
jgi:hypothetical protein